MIDMTGVVAARIRPQTRNGKDGWEWSVGYLWDEPYGQGWAESRQMAEHRARQWRDDWAAILGRKMATPLPDGWITLDEEAPNGETAP